ncbi:MAG: hypothetical protein ACFFG0_04025 [Candidatus Thorarchaeota archaeon]
MESSDIECKGCNNLIINYCELTFDEYEQEAGDCPCLTCIVKSMCVIGSSSCDIFKEYAVKQMG